MENAENVGVISFADAMQRARDAGLDLVEVDSNSNPPVCRILDYGKWKYEQARRSRRAASTRKGTMIHEVRLRPRTGQHDIDLKVRIATRLLGEGDKVKLSVMFRGREMSHPEIGHEVLQKALTGLGETASVEKQPGMEGRFLTVILTPNAKKPTGEGNRLKARPGRKARRRGQTGKGRARSGRRARAGSRRRRRPWLKRKPRPNPRSRGDSWPRLRRRSTN